MLIRALATISIAALAAPLLIGCSTGSQRVVRGSPSPSLVLPGEALVSLERSGPEPSSLRAWEFGRHDQAMGLGLGRTPDIPALRFSETRVYDRQWTSNGRPREHSRSFTTTIDRRIHD